MSTARRVLDALQPYQLKQVGRGMYRLNAPTRPGSNSQAFSLKIDDDEHGVYTDHVSGESGTLYELAEKLNIDLPQRDKAQDTKRAYDGAEDYAKAHALSMDDLRAAGWYEAIEDGRPALAFKTANGVRYRFLDGQTPSYKSPHGFQSSWYGMRRGLDMARDFGALVLVNGEISAVTGQKYGIPAVTIAGGGERQIPDALLKELQSKWQGEIWIALDCDSKGRDASTKIAAQLPNAKVLDLGLTDKGDLADLCALYTSEAPARLKGLAAKPVQVVQEAPPAAGVDALAKAMQEVAKAQRANQPIDTLLDKAEAQIKALRTRPEATTLSIREIVDTNEAAMVAAKANPATVRGLRCGINCLDETIGGWRGGMLHIMLAATSMGKSTFSAQLAAHFSHQASGIIAPTESSPYGFVNKMAASLRGLNTNRIESGYLSQQEFDAALDAYDMLSWRPVHFLAGGRTTPAMIREAIQRQLDAGTNIQWVIVDSLSKLHVDGYTSLYDITSAAVDELQNIAIDTGLMLFATSQTGRSAKDRAVKAPQINDAKGSGDVEEDADVLLSLYRHDYYVARGEQEPNPKYPPGTALIRVLKHRWKDVGDGAAGLIVNAVAGTRFEDREVQR